MHSFAMLEHVEGTEPPLLSIKTHHWFTPHLVIPLQGVDPDLVYAYLLERVRGGRASAHVRRPRRAWMGF
jgi:hypothetical protein